MVQGLLFLKVRARVQAIFIKYVDFFNTNYICEKEQLNLLLVPDEMNEKSYE